MWLKENEFKIMLGGTFYQNIRTALIAYDRTPLFMVRRHEDTGQVAIDCEIYAQDGRRLATIRRNMVYTGDKDSYDVVSTDQRVCLREKSSGVILAEILKRESAIPVELMVSVHTYAPNGVLLDLTPERSRIGTNTFTSCKAINCNIGINLGSDGSLLFGCT